MKISSQELNRIILEEVQAALKEVNPVPTPMKKPEKKIPDLKKPKKKKTKDPAPPVFSDLPAPSHKTKIDPKKARKRERDYQREKAKSEKELDKTKDKSKSYSEKHYKKEAEKARSKLNEEGDKIIMYGCEFAKGLSKPDFVAAGRRCKSSYRALWHSKYDKYLHKSKGG